MKKAVWIAFGASLVLVNLAAWVAEQYSGFHVAMVYRLEDGQLAKVPGAGGLTPKDSSPDMRAREVQYAYSWFENIKHDSWG